MKASSRVLRNSGSIRQGFIFLAYQWASRDAPLLMGLRSLQFSRLFLEVASWLLGLLPLIMNSGQQRRGNERKEEGAVPVSGRQKLDIPVDSHLISLVETSHCPPLPEKVGKELLAGHDASPHRMSLLVKEKGKNVSSSQSSLSQPLSHLHLMEMRQLAQRR